MRDIVGLQIKNLASTLKKLVEKAHFFNTEVLG